MWNDRVMLTRWTGRSFGKPSSDPIMKLPASTRTIVLGTEVEAGVDVCRTGVLVEGALVGLG
jgi:hypothetical protein